MGARLGYQEREALMMAPECRNGCQYLTACQIEFKAAESLKLTEGKAMSQALWCDEHEGSFSSKDRAKRTITSTIQDEDGADATETYTMCGPCANRFRVGGAATLPPATPAPTPTPAADPTVFGSHP